MPDHSTCPNVLRDGMAEQGIEVKVTDAPPPVVTPFTERFRCPHGTTFWMEPTDAQFTAWAAEEVA